METESRTTRTRWAAIGAAVAVSIGAGGIGLARAADGDPSAFVPVTPARILDTRSDLGLVGPFTSPAGRTLQVTGGVPTPDGEATVVPVGATAVVFNVTAVQPQADGFISVRPDGTAGSPSTSNLNFTAGDIVPNSVTVALPATGRVDIVYDAFGVVGPITDVLVDVTGYYVHGGTGEPGPQGPQGPAGPPGTPAEAFGGPGVGIPDLDPQIVLSSIDETITTVTSGRLMITKSALVDSFTCFQQTSRFFYLLVDGAPVRSSAVQVPIAAGSGLDRTLVGVTDDVIPAGEHVIGVGAQCSQGAGGGASYTNVSSSTFVVVPG